MRNRVPDVDVRATLGALVRILVASTVAAGLAVLAWWGLDAGLERSLGAQIVAVGLALGVATGAYLVACRALRVRELGSLLSLRRGDR